VWGRAVIFEKVPEANRTFHESSFAFRDPADLPCRDGFAFDDYAEISSGGKQLFFQGHSAIFAPVKIS